MTLSQAEYDHLLSLEKFFVDESPITLARSWTREIGSSSTRDTFMLDYRTRTIELTKYSYNHRYRKAIVLVRLCSSGRHRNPDGTSFDGPHLHLYQEGFDDKVAFPIDELGIAERDLGKVSALDAVLNYCNIQRTAGIQTSIGDDA